MAFAFVALAAVVLTTWMTIGAVIGAQRELFQGVEGLDPGRTLDGPARVWPPWRRGGMDSGPAAEAFGRITRTAFGAGALSFLLAVIAAGLFTRFLTRPLHALTRGAKRLEAGERGIRLPVPHGRDELRSLTEAFNGLVEGLERQETWRRNMTADIAHDLRTPLAVLRSEIEGMQDGVVATGPDALGRLHREVMLLARLVDDLRTLSVSEGGALSLRRTSTELEPFLRRSLEAFRSRAAALEATLELLPIERGLSAPFDADRISQVIGNLLDNALRHAGPVRIEVGAEPVERVAAGARSEPASDADGSDERAADEVPGIRIWVRDHGPGLPAGAQEQVFERFYRGDASRTRARGATPGVAGDGVETGADAVGGAAGTGLGLAIARAIVTAHGGSMRAFDHPAGGAVFELFLPLSP